MIIDLAYFQETYKTKYKIDNTKPIQVRAFENFELRAAHFLLGILGKPKYTETDYNTEQLEVIKFCVCVWIDHFLKVGYSLTPKGSKSVQQLGYNIAITNPENPEFVPVIIKTRLTSVDLYSQIKSVSVFGDSSSTSSIDTSKWGF